MGSRNSLNLIPDGLALLARHPDQARALMTHRFAFADLQQAYALMRNRTEKVGKILIEMPRRAAALPDRPHRPRRQESHRHEHGPMHQAPHAGEHLAAPMTSWWRAAAPPGWWRRSARPTPD